MAILVEICLEMVEKVTTLSFVPV